MVSANISCSLISCSKFGSTLVKEGSLHNDIVSFRATLPSRSPASPKVSPTLSCTSLAICPRRTGKPCTTWPRCSCTVSTTGNWSRRPPGKTSCRKTRSQPTKSTTLGGSAIAMFRLSATRYRTTTPPSSSEGLFSNPCSR